MKQSSATASIAPRELLAGRVCVVVTAYNAARFIARAVHSALNQNWPELHVIVVDDGSTDGTAGVAKSIGGNVEVVRLPTNRGPAVGRTLGLEHADGEFVAFLDADDYWLPGFVEATVGFLLIHPEAIAAYTGYRKLDWDGRQYDRPVLTSEDQVAYGGPSGVVLPDLYAFWGRYSNILTGTVMMRTDVARRTGGQREELRLTQDLEFWGYLATFGPWGFINRPLFMTDQRVLTGSERLRKFKRRFQFFSSIDVDDWCVRIHPRLPHASKPGFEKIRAHIATTILIANAYCLHTHKAWTLAAQWSDRLDGSIGAFLRLGYRCGKPTWPLFCIAVPIREHLKARLSPMYRLLSRVGKCR